VRAAAETRSGDGDGLEPTTLELCRAILATEASPHLEISARGGLVRLKLG